MANESIQKTFGSTTLFLTAYKSLQNSPKSKTVEVAIESISGIFSRCE
jgi:hypothetical protein